MTAALLLSSTDLGKRSLILGPVSSLHPSHAQRSVSQSLDDAITSVKSTKKGGKLTIICRFETVASFFFLQNYSIAGNNLRYKYIQRLPYITRLAVYYLIN